MNHFLTGGLPLKYRAYSKTEEAPNIPIGVYCIMFGVVFIAYSDKIYPTAKRKRIDKLLFQPLYILCLSALIQRDLRVIPVYRIMILLGIFDVIMLTINTFVTGFFFIKGVVFCTFPTAIYTIGCISDSCWGGSCIGCFFLIFTRLIDLWCHRLHDFLFGGVRMRVVLFICVCYTLPFFLFASPALFNVKYYSWMFDPVISDSTQVFQVSVGLTLRC
ncbi:hypothetical protein OESDEN_01730 [Oesophagostomum dentatum]|uniref:Uncharacterized protein n=1 Tax=Oesophagostomum dentatum TaxID=61180 RepID=A0A0B1TSB0_OESDE|nr:hypothetical protein OESDEN_01730 [Oesophagostomum dentatum]